MNILVVEDDGRIAHGIERALVLADHRVQIAVDGALALGEATTREYDLILLDVLLPVLDGLSVCRELRRRKVQTPILMLTARDALGDRVSGLDAGADDYLTKPFATEELLARVRALARRGGVPEGPLRVADLVLDTARHEVQRSGRALELTPREFELLHFLMRHAGQVVSRGQIFQNVWRNEANAGSKAVDLYMHYLRTKIDRDTARPLIRTVRGYGYMIDG
ncbi:MAG TPA: response regulator transcription factor [Chloroflexota bacterium]|jgi:DNA-binding response OmpR family regulator